MEASHERLCAAESFQWVASEKYLAQWKLRKATYEAAGASNVEGVRPKLPFFIQWQTC